MLVRIMRVFTDMVTFIYGGSFVKKVVQFVYVNRIVNKHMWQTYHSGYGNETKIFKPSIARQVKLPLLIAGPIIPSNYFQ